jgi:nitrous oxide reductase
MTDKKPENLKRRGFLLAASVGGAGAVAAIAAGAGQKTAELATTVNAEEKTSGYAETRHVSNYYRTARV